MIRLFYRHHLVASPCKISTGHRRRIKNFISFGKASKKIHHYPDASIDSGIRERKIGSQRESEQADTLGSTWGCLDTKLDRVPKAFSSRWGSGEK